MFDFTLLGFDVLLVVSEDPEDFFGDFSVCVKVVGMYHDIVDIHHNVSSGDEVLEEVVHHCLEGGW